MYLPHAAQSFCFAIVPTLRPGHPTSISTGVVSPAPRAAAARRLFRRTASMLSPARLSHRLTAPARLGALLVLVATALLGTGQRASAQQSYVWNGSGSNDWNT